MEAPGNPFPGLLQLLAAVRTPGLAAPSSAAPASASIVTSPLSFDLRALLEKTLVIA